MFGLDQIGTLLEGITMVFTYLSVVPPVFAILFSIALIFFVIRLIPL